MAMGDRTIAISNSSDSLTSGGTKYKPPPGCSKIRQPDLGNSKWRGHSFVTNLIEYCEVPDPIAASFECGWAGGLAAAPSAGPGTFTSSSESDVTTMVLVSLQPAPRTNSAATTARKPTRSGSGRWRERTSGEACCVI